MNHLRELGHLEGREPEHILDKMIKLYDWYSKCEQKIGGSGERGRVYFASKETPGEIVAIGEFKFGNTKEKVPYHFAPLKSARPLRVIPLEEAVEQNDS